MRVLSSSTGMAKQLQLVETENFQQSFSLIQRMNNCYIDIYSSLSNKRAAQIIVFLKKCSLHSLITSCTNYCFFEKMQPAHLCILHKLFIFQVKIVNLQKISYFPTDQMLNLKSYHAKSIIFFTFLP